MKTYQDILDAFSCIQHHWCLNISKTIFELHLTGILYMIVKSGIKVSLPIVAIPTIKKINVIQYSYP